jgi:quinone-modifying oxidoreductase subunit QmoC
MVSREVSVPTLAADARRFGVFNAQGCFACGSCTLVCDLATDAASFPRRPMQSVVLGLKESLLLDLDPWLCHDCGDCSTACPRQAEPRQSMATLRRYLSSQYDWTGLSARILRSAGFEMAALGAVAMAVLALIVWYHLTVAKLDLATLRSTAMGMDHMFPRIQYFTAAVFVIPGLFVLSNVWRMHHLTMGRAGIPLRFYIAEATALLVNAVAHVKILKCAAVDRRKKWTMHWLMACGCVVLVVIKLFFLRWFQTDNIYPIYHPQRWLGYLAAAGIALGAGEILVDWFRERRPQQWSSRRSDLTLPLLLVATAASGLAVHVSRYAGLNLTAHYLYALHLMIAVPMLVVEVPFGHWAHMIYRPLALYFAAVESRAAMEQEAGKAVTA